MERSDSDEAPRAVGGATKDTDPGGAAGAAWYDALFRGSTEPTYLLDLETLRVVDANAAFTGLLGYDRDEALRLTLDDIVAIAPEENRAFVADLVANGHAKNHYRVWRASSGAAITMNVVGHRLAYEGRQVGFVAGRDVTEWLEAIEARRVSEENYRRLVESAADPVLVFTDERVAYANPAAVRFLRAGSAAELIGWRLWDLLHPDFHAVVRERIAGSLGPEKTNASPLEERWIRCDGSVVYAEATGAPAVYAGRPATQVIVRDVTERKRAQEDLRATHERLRAVLDASPFAIITVDSETRIRTWNSSAERLYGWKSADALGRLRTEIVPSTEGAFESRMARVLAGGTIGREREQRRRADGTLVDVEFYVSPYFDAAGKVAGAISVSTDLTELKSLERQFQQAQKMEAIGRLAGGVAHDFNNVLTAILATTELVSDELGRSGPLYDEVKDIRSAVERAAALTHQLLAFSRQQVLQPAVLRVNQVVSSMQALLGRVLGEDIWLRTELDPDAGHVRADSGQLDQVLMNLAVNARDAMPGGGALTIRTGTVAIETPLAAVGGVVAPGSYATIAVMDEGMGMDQATREHVFEPFFTTKPVGRGTGLGLPTVYGIVRQSGGYIVVESEPGEGSTFTIYLPHATDEYDAGEAAGPERPRRARGGNETILLVEDDAAIRSVARRILVSYGYDVVAVADGDAAIGAAGGRDGAFDLLLTDVVMPGMNGRELAERLKALQKAKRVLYVSGYTDDAILHHGVLEPGVSFLNKPYGPDGLARKVRETLDRSVAG